MVTEDINKHKVTVNIKNIYWPIDRQKYILIDTYIVTKDVINIINAGTHMK